MTRCWLDDSEREIREMIRRATRWSFHIQFLIGMMNESNWNGRWSNRNGPDKGFNRNLGQDPDDSGETKI